MPSAPVGSAAAARAAQAAALSVSTCEILEYDEKYGRWERRQGSIVAPKVTKPTLSLPDGMCLPTG